MLTITVMILAGLLSLPIMMVLSASIGDMPITFNATFRAITNGLGLSHYSLPPVEAGIVAVPNESLTDGCW